jgi:hypothetical protein
MIRAFLIFLILIFTACGLENSTREIENEQSKNELIDWTDFAPPKRISLQELIEQRKSYLGRVLRTSLPCGSVVVITDSGFIINGRYNKFINYVPGLTHVMICCWEVTTELLDLFQDFTSSTPVAGGTDPMWDAPVAVLLSEYHAEQIQIGSENSPPGNVPTSSLCRGHWLQDAELRFVFGGFCGSKPLFLLEELAEDEGDS